MKENDTISKKKLDRLKIIYNDDIRIIDFLSDLTDRKVLRDLDDFVKDAKGLSGCLLIPATLDDIVVLILYKSPFALNDPGNDFILYAGNDLHELMVYFKNLLDNTSESKTIINNALNDIVRLLYKEWISQNDKSAQLNRVD
jgi:hypothetical protein